MKTIKIKLSTVDSVKNLIAINMVYAHDIDITDGHYIVDGKSILGVFSLSLLNPLDVNISFDKMDEATALIERYRKEGFLYE